MDHIVSKILEQSSKIVKDWNTFRDNTNTVIQIHPNLENESTWLTDNFNKTDEEHSSLYRQEYGKNFDDFEPIQRVESVNGTTGRINGLGHFLYYKLWDQNLKQEQIDELNLFFNRIINAELALWRKRKDISLSADYSQLPYSGCVQICFMGNDEERLLLDINIHTGFFRSPKNPKEYREHFFLLGDRKLKCNRYTICCENNCQARLVLAVFNAQYRTEFKLTDNLVNVANINSELMRSE